MALVATVLVAAAGLDAAAERVRFLADPAAAPPADLQERVRRRQM